MQWNAPETRWNAKVKFDFLFIAGNFGWTPAPPTHSDDWPGYCKR